LFKSAQTTVAPVGERAQWPVRYRNLIQLQRQFDLKPRLQCLSEGLIWFVTREVGNSEYGARLSGPDNESWILERIERYFPDTCVESVLERITLVGGLISGERILPSVRKTNAFALSKQNRCFLVMKAFILMP
jgi:hypothetical protein